MMLGPLWPLHKCSTGASALEYKYFDRSGPISNITFANLLQWLSFMRKLLLLVRYFACSKLKSHGGKSPGRLS